MKVTVEKVIDAYLKLRIEKETKDAKHREEVKAIKEKMGKLEGWIKTQADEQGVTSFRTDNGTAFLTTSDYANVADWDSVLRYIQKHEAFDLLERRVSKMAVRGYIDLNKSVPPGVNYGTAISVSVRKPTVKAEETTGE
jgi:ATP-dependent Lon protease